MRLVFQVVALLTVLILSLSGCIIIVPGSSVPDSPAAVKQTPADETAPPGGMIDEFTDFVHTSEALGIAFTMPISWLDKCRVEEGDDRLTVYFDPHEPIDPNEGDGMLFCIAFKTEDVDESCFDNSKELDLDGAIYIWGEPTDARYHQGQPAYDTYAGMLKDLPAIRDTVRPATGDEPKNILPVKVNSTPDGSLYISTLHRLTFIVPDSWVGKYRVEEEDGCVSVYFKPEEPDVEKNGDGLLFMLVRKEGSTILDADFLEELPVIDVNGVEFAIYEPTDVSYEGLERKTFDAMNGQRQEVYETIEAAY